MTQESQGTAVRPERQLKRAIGPWALAANVVNLTVGAGIFAMPAVVAGMLGPAAWIAYLVCAMLILLVMTCFAEVGSQVTRSGGAIAYIEEAFGPTAGFAGWMLFSVSFSVVSDAAIANYLADSLATLYAPLHGGVARVLFMAVLFGGLAWLNIRGVKQGTGFSVAITLLKLLPLVLIVAVGVSAVRPANLAMTGWPSLHDIGGAALVLFFAFAGMESALTPSGEIRDARRTVPRGVLGGALAVIVLYLGLQFVSQGVLGAALPMHKDAPLADVAGMLAGSAGHHVVLACAALCVFGALAADTIGTPRGFLAVAEAGDLPRVLARVHPRYRTPWVSILAFAGSAFVIAITGAFRPLAVLSSVALLLVYLGVVLACVRLRYARPRPPGSFRAPGGPLVAVLAGAAVIWLLAHSSGREFASIAGVLLGSLAYDRIRRHLRGRPRDRNA